MGFRAWFLFTISINWKFYKMQKNLKLKIFWPTHQVPPGGTSENFSKIFFCFLDVLGDFEQLWKKNFFWIFFPASRPQKSQCPGAVEGWVKKIRVRNFIAFHMIFSWLRLWTKITFGHPCWLKSHLKWGPIDMEITTTSCAEHQIWSKTSIFDHFG